jgi:hypothetical protein
MLGCIKGDPPVNDIEAGDEDAQDNETSLSGYEDYLIIAQQHFDQLRRKLRHTASRQGPTKKGTAKSKVDVDLETRSDQLLCTLLYLGIMTNQVNEIKVQLKEDDPDLYDEWAVLLNSLHPPTFHFKERRLQNDRVKRIFERKCFYKDQAEFEKQNSQAQRETTRELQNKSNEEIQNLTSLISILTDENKGLKEQLTVTHEGLKTQYHEAEKEIQNLKKNLHQSGLSEKQAQHTAKDWEEQLNIAERSAFEANRSYNSRLAESRREITMTRKDLSEMASEVSTARDVRATLLETQMQLSNAQEKSRKLEDDLATASLRIKTHATELSTKDNEALNDQITVKRGLELKLGAAENEVKDLKGLLRHTHTASEIFRQNAEELKCRCNNAERDAGKASKINDDRLREAQMELTEVKAQIFNLRFDVSSGRDSRESLLKIKAQLMSTQEISRRLENELNVATMRLDVAESERQKSQQVQSAQICNPAGEQVEQQCSKVSHSVPCC